MDGSCILLGLVNSQTFGLNSKYYETVYQEQYKPLLTVLHDFPGISLSFYNSAFFLEWLESKHPEALMLLGDLVKRKQVEMLGGAFYEPILPVIPSADRNIQIEDATTFLRRQFSRRPRGAWLGEMIWESTVPVALKNCGIEYTFIDDTYFKIAGLKGEELYSPVITEDQGKAVMVFPVDTEIRKFFLENTPEDSFSFLLGRAKGARRETPAGRKVISVFFDCAAWESKNLADWLKGFFSLVLSGGQELSLEQPETLARSPQTLKKVYFPSLVPGVMFPDRKKNPIHGNPRSLLEIYPEINLLYSKQIYVGLLINQYRGDKSRKKTARQDLCKVQNNGLYWYPPGKEEYYKTMRQEGYKVLLSTECLVREAGIFKPNILPYDFDMNGQDEYLYQGQSFNAYISTEGARLFELDYLEKPWNYQDTDCHWIRPRGNRDSFIDAFYTEDEHPRKTANVHGGFSLDGMAYTMGRLDKDEQKILFELETKIPDLFGKKRTILLQKEYAFKKNMLLVFYEIKNPSSQELDFHFSTELNLSFASRREDLVIDYLSRGKLKTGGQNGGQTAGQTGGQNGTGVQDGKAGQDSAAGPAGTGREDHYRDIKLVNVKDTKNKTSLSLTVSKNCELITAVREVEDPRQGPLSQGMVFLFNWKKKLEAQQSWTVEVSLKLEKLSQAGGSG